MSRKIILLRIVLLLATVVSVTGVGYTAWNGSGIEVKLEKRNEFRGALQKEQRGIESLSVVDPLNLDLADWNTFQASEHGLKLKYPREFSVYGENAWPEEIADVPCVMTEPSHFVRHSVILSREDLGRCVTFVGWESWPGDLLVHFTDEEWPNFPYVLGEEGAELTSVAGVPAVIYPFTPESERPRKQATRIYLNHTGRGYMIEIVQTDDQGSYEPVFDLILSTIELN